MRTGCVAWEQDRMSGLCGMTCRTTLTILRKTTSSICIVQLMHRCHILAILLSWFHAIRIPACIMVGHFCHGQEVLLVPHLLLMLLPASLLMASQICANWV